MAYYLLTAYSLKTHQHEIIWENGDLQSTLSQRKAFEDDHEEELSSFELHILPSNNRDKIETLMRKRNHPYKGDDKD